MSFVALLQFMNHFSDADEIRNSNIEMQPEYYNAFVCESLNERYKIMRNKLPIDPIVEDGKDYFIIKEVQRFIRILTSNLWTIRIIC